ncbi:histidinol-phosphatase [bacterium]|nr:histidinol-phosphatase [bacterium]
MTELDQYKDFTKAMLKVVMPFIRDAFNSRAYHVEVKKDLSPVTEIDRKAEMMLREMIAKNFPSHAILGEEFGAGGSAEYTWVLDPIDGTKSFVSGSPLFGTLIALLKDGKPILGAIGLPMRDEVYLGDNTVTEVNGTPVHVKDALSLKEAVILTTDICDIARLKSRPKFDALIEEGKIFRMWGDCYGYALIAGGLCAVMSDAEMNPWDILPLIPVIRGAGGVITGWEGQDPVGASSCLAGPPTLHKLALAILN